MIELIPNSLKQFERDNKKLTIVCGQLFILVVQYLR